MLMLTKGARDKYRFVLRTRVQGNWKRTELEERGAALTKRTTKGSKGIEKRCKRRQQDIAMSSVGVGVGVEERSRDTKKLVFLKNEACEVACRERSVAIDSPPLGPRAGSGQCSNQNHIYTYIVSHMRHPLE